jgi:hypothetical protein
MAAVAAKNSKKGSFTVEAAIFLPVFIIGVLTIAYLLKVIAVEENVFNALSDEARCVAAEASAMPYPLFFQSDITARAEGENGDELENFQISRFSYRYSEGGYTDQIRVTAKYDVKVKLPAAAPGLLPVSDTILCRAFVGSLHGHEPIAAEELEHEEESVTVWVFPRSGTKYHGPGCVYVTSYPKEMTLSEGLRRRYDPCELCEPKTLGNGSLVYCFEAGGRAFHKAECSVVERYVISMERSEASARGYTACSVCGGN